MLLQTASRQYKPSLPFAFSRPASTWYEKATHARGLLLVLSVLAAHPILLPPARALILRMTCIRPQQVILVLEAYGPDGDVSSV